MKNTSLNKVEWSPDGKIILIGTRELEIHIFDCGGNFIRKMPLPSIPNFHSKVENFVGIKWFKTDIQLYPLMIVYDNGAILLMKNELDDSPLIINCEMQITSAEWNPMGNLFAITGKYDAEGNKIRFFILK